MITDLNIAISQQKIVRFRWNLVHKCRFGTRWQSCDQIWEFNFWNSKWRTSAILKIVFAHNSAADCPISVTFCTGKQNGVAIDVT